MTELAGKVVIVTGASRGMGSHFVDALVAQGAQVACLARPSAELEAVAARHGEAARAFPCDVGHLGQIDEAVAAVVAHFGKLDVLVNNAAVFDLFRIEDATPEQVESHVAVNLTGPLWCIRAAIPHLRASRGQIVSVSSESVRMPFPYLTFYAATKAALENLSQGLRDELREDGIRVSVLRSGSVAGGTGTSRWHPETAKEFFATIQRTGHAAFTGHAAEPQSMARALVALLSIPADVNVDIMETRATGAAQVDSFSRRGTPGGAR